MVSQHRVSQKSTKTQVVTNVGTTTQGVAREDVRKQGITNRLP